VQFATDFITNSTKSGTKFFLYLAWNHVHVPDFATAEFCNSSIRGRYGDALKELDHSIGRVLKAVKVAGVDDDTIIFFTSDNGPVRVCVRLRPCAHSSRHQAPARCGWRLAVAGRRTAVRSRFV
jgi:arylsulfatase A-like enzyme